MLFIIQTFLNRIHMGESFYAAYKYIHAYVYIHTHISVCVSSPLIGFPDATTEKELVK